MTYGCYNRAPLREHVVVQAGWGFTNNDPFCLERKSNMVWIPNPMTKDCQYSVNTVDPLCAGCAHNNSTPKETTA